MKFARDNYLSFPVKKIQGCGCAHISFDIDKRTRLAMLKKSDFHRPCIDKTRGGVSLDFSHAPNEPCSVFIYIYVYVIKHHVVLSADCSNSKRSSLQSRGSTSSLLERSLTPRSQPPTPRWVTNLCAQVYSYITYSHNPIQKMHYLQSRALALSVVKLNNKTFC